jgi:hypothetical protein
MVHKEKKLLTVQTNAVNALLGSDEQAEANMNDSFDNSFILATNDEDILNNSLVLPPSAEEINEVDRLIQEKEEILNKLLDNVKSYNAIKMEFEKLVDAIGSLENEKQELENELEKAKKTNNNSLQMEKMKDRFLQVKDELKKMQNEKKNKESVYKLMQKESKQCEIMQKEVSKLKESRVALMKQQKSTVQQLQKLKKENQVKEQNFKKSEIKKQQMMNNLKSELSKKERIIGHKEKELARVIAKLKACEDHITQLLKIQNRNRNKIVNPNDNGNNSNIPSITNTKGGKANGSSSNNLNAAANSKNNAFFNSEKYKNQLDSHDYEYYLTSKNLLDQVLITQIEKKLILVQYQKKANELKELNNELLHETQELENLQALKQQIMSENNLFAATGANDQPLLSEESNYEVENIQKRISYTENNIERISKEIDLYNSDLDDLSLRLDESHTTNNENGGVTVPMTTEGLLMANFSSANNNWQSISNEIISSLNHHQSQLFINELLNEKLLSLETARLLEANLQKIKNDNILLNEKHQELIHFNSDMNSNYLEKMKNLEKQRISEIWTILKSQEEIHKLSMTPTEGEDGGMEGLSEAKKKELLEAQEIIQSISMQRTKDLEKELENFMLSDENLKQSNTEKSITIQSLNYELEKLSNELSVYQQSSDGIENSGNEKVRIPSTYLKEVSQYWNEIGYSKDSQNEMISSILQSQVIIQNKLLMECKQEFTNKQSEIQKLLNNYETILGFTGLSLKEFNEKYLLSSGLLEQSEIEILLSCSDIKGLYELKPQQKCLALFQKVLFIYSQVFYEKERSKLLNLKENFDCLMKEMMLLEGLSASTVQISTTLQSFAKIRFPSAMNWEFLENMLNQIQDSSSMAPSEETKAEFQFSFVHEIMKLIQSLTFASLTIGKEWNLIDSELKQLNLLRIQFTNKIIGKRDSILVLLKDLSISYQDSTSNELSLLIHSILMNENSFEMTMSSEDNNGSSPSESKKKENKEKLIQLSLQILSMKSLSNPPGAESLLLILEKIQLLLESVKCNRINLSSLIVTLLQSWLKNFDEFQLIQSMDSSFLSFEHNNKTVNLQDYLHVLTKAKENNNSRMLYQKESMETLLMVLTHVIEKKWKQIYSTEIEKLLTFMKTFNNLNSNSSLTSSPGNGGIIIQENLLGHIRSVSKQILQQYQKKYLSDTASTAANSNEAVEEHYQKVITAFTEFFDECSSIMPFVEENWIQEQLLSLVSLWEQSNHSSSYLTIQDNTNVGDLRYSLKEVIYQCSFFWIEIQRFQCIYETFQEMRKQDSLYVKHITEFEEFETNSVKDRAKVLSGNSKALIEEEKYRKNAKKKYEVISEKLIQIFQKLISLTTMPFSSAMMTESTAPVATAPASTVSTSPVVMLECAIDLNCFSQYTQNILKNGIQKERLELIRLHTSAAMFSLPNSNPVTSTTAASTTATTGNSAPVKRMSQEKEKETTSSSNATSTKDSSTLVKSVKDKAPSSLYQKNKEKAAAVVKSTKMAAPGTIASKSASSKANAANSQPPQPPAQPIQPHHHYHRLSINSRLSISTSEPGLISANNNGSNNIAYSFQPPTPPSHDEVQSENLPNNQNHETKPAADNNGKVVSNEVMNGVALEMDLIESSL